MKLKSVLEKNNGLIKKDNLPNLVVHFLNRKITFMTAEAIIEEIHNACFDKKKLIIASYNVHSFNLSMLIPWFYEFQQNAKIALCDGMGILKGMDVMGVSLPLEYRTSVTTLAPKLLEHCNQHNLSVFLLGAKPQHLELALNQQKKNYPNIKFSGHHGYFDKEDPVQNERVIEQINQANPDILIIGMGMPVQEYWVHQHHSKLKARVIIPCGAVIDRLAGMVPNCPTQFSNIGLEWLYRLAREPKRLAVRYLLGNPVFLFSVALAKFLEFSPLYVTEVQTRSKF